MSLKCIGIDISGTSVKLGIFEEDGTPAKKWEISTKKKRRTERICPAILRLRSDRTAKKESGLRTLLIFPEQGMGFPGPVLPDGHCEVCMKPRLESGKSAAGIKRTAGRNDCKSGNERERRVTLGEICAGWRKGYKNLIMVTLGTGVGGSIIPLNERSLDR